MARLEVNPRYRDWLAEQGLRQAADFLRLSGVILCGHPDRNVAQITLGSDRPVSLYLKKEHRVRRKYRLRNAGVSQSLREARILRRATVAGINCPEVIAAGEQGKRAFLLLRDISDAVEVRQRLGGADDRRLAAVLGEALAALHARGFIHGDLFSKHVLIDAEYGIHFLDWQRARRVKTIRWQDRVRELACLDATVSDDACSPRVRLRCLRSYLRVAGVNKKLCVVAREIRDVSAGLLRKRYVREIRQSSLDAEKQNLIWLRGEEFCVTKAFLETLGSNADAATAQLMSTLYGDEQQPCAEPDCLVSRSNERSFRAWLWSVVRRRRFASKELTHAATLFRLERFGVPVPKLLAVGQRFSLPWRVRSFLMTSRPHSVSLSDWCKNTMSEHAGRQALNDVEDLLRRIETAGYALRNESDIGAAFAVELESGTVFLAKVDALRRCPSHSRQVESLWQRIVHGSRRVLARADWHVVLGPDWPERIMGVPVTDQFHAKQGRSTGRCMFDVGASRLAVFLKRHYSLSWWRGLLAILFPRVHWTPAFQEYQHLRWAQRHGLPVPAPVAVGVFVGPGLRLQSFLAVEELQNMLPLHEAIPLAMRQRDTVAFARWKRGLTAELARLIRELHGHNRFHKDLYLCHFFVSREDTSRTPDWHGRVVMIDLHRLGHHPFTRHIWRIKDLAELMFSTDLPGISARDRLRFWKLYYGPRRRGVVARCLGWFIRFKWQRYLRHNERRYGYKTEFWRVRPAAEATQGQEVHEDRIVL